MADALPFEVGAVSQATAAALSIIAGLYAFASSFYTWRAFHAKLADRWSALLASVVMVLVAVVLWRDGARLLPAPFSVVVLLLVVIGVVVSATYTLGRFQDHIDRFQERFGARLQSILEEMVPEDRLAEFQRLRERFRPDGEGARKMPHLLMAVFLVFYMALGWAVLRGAWLALYGGTGTDVGEGVHNLYVASHDTWLAAGHMFGLTLLLGLVFLLLPNELMRLRFPELSYPFKALIQATMRKRETGLFGAHYYITAALALVALWLPRDGAMWEVTIPAVLAVLAVTVIADASSALFGRRFGRRKWPHNRDKSYVGSLAGTLVAVAVALPFVGVPMAIVTGVVFLVVDVGAPVPVAISDNILNPLLLALTYTVLHGALDPMIPFY